MIRTTESTNYLLVVSEVVGSQLIYVVEIIDGKQNLIAVATGDTKEEAMLKCSDMFAARLK